MNAADPPSIGHAMRPVGRFSDRGEDYARYRPGYPAQVFDEMLRRLGPPAGLQAADIGAGTGISARQLADRGVAVLAIEPNASMRQAAAPHPRVTWREGRAEATGLDAHGVDLVLCAQSYHWFDPAAALPEFHRILKPGSQLALLWNRRDGGDAATAEFTDLLTRYADDSTPEYLPLDPPFDPAPLRASGLFQLLPGYQCANSQQLTLEGLLGRALSASFVQRSGPKCEAILSELRQMHPRFADADGTVTLRYLTDLHLAVAIPS